MTARIALTVLVAAVTLSKMAAIYDFDDSDSGDSIAFAGFNATDRRTFIPDDQQSDVSSVQTNDLSDFNDSITGESGSDIEISEDESESEEVAFDVDNIEVDWKENNFDLVQRHFFVQDSGPNLPPAFDTNSSPIGYFHLLFPEQLVKDITSHTNSYAQFCIRSK